MWKLDGRILQPDVPFWHEGISYPANWLAVSSMEDKAALGITPADPPQMRPDDRYYYVEDKGDGTYTATPKDLDQVKAVRTNEVKAQASAILGSTDWYVIRHAETEDPVPGHVTDHRDDIRLLSDEYENAINDCTTIEELAALSFDWPTLVAPPKDKAKSGA